MAVHQNAGAITSAAIIDWFGVCIQSHKEDVVPKMNRRFFFFS
jgi:hypothetical protein